MRCRFAALLALFLIGNQALAQFTPLPFCAKVDPFWGCDGAATFVGACSPYGMVRLGPDCAIPKSTIPYRSDKPILGFSFNHLTGFSGDNYYGNLLATPQVGEPNWKDRGAESKSDEFCSPGFYAVKLQRKSGNVDVELTANQNVGRQRFRFKKPNQPGAVQASVLIDLHSNLAENPKVSFKECDFFAGADGSFSGNASFSTGSVGKYYTIHFAGQTNLKNPVLRHRIDTIRSTISIASKKKTVLKFDSIGFSFSGQVLENEEIELTIAISYKNKEEAANALAKSLTQKFEDIRAKSQQAWEDRLSVFALQNYVQDQVSIFYSALYQTLVLPTDVSGNHPKDQFGESHFWDHALGDVSRCLMPLHSLIYAQSNRRICNSLIRIAEERGGLPNAWTVGDFGYSSGGCPAEVVLADAVNKGLLTGLDAGKVWKVCYKNATQKSDHPDLYGRPLEYLNIGYCTDLTPYSVSKSLEYAYNDFVMSKMGQKLGKSYESEKLLKRSFQVLNLWNKQRTFFWPKDTLSHWKPTHNLQSSPQNISNYFQGNTWTDLLAAPHLADTIRALLGGSQALALRLDSLFDGNHFDIHHSPCLSLPFAYLTAGQSDKTANRVDQLVNANFKIGKKGLPAGDNSGTLSSWLIWAYMGVYPLVGTDEFWVFRPFHLGKMDVILSGGKTLKISGSGSRLYWNNKPLIGNKLKAVDLQAGGSIDWREK